MSGLTDQMSKIVLQSTKMSTTTKMLAVAVTTGIIYLLRKLREGRDNSPPGSFGLPFLGETIQYVLNVASFVAKRKAKYGPIFKTHILWSPAVYLDGEHAKVVFKSTDIAWPSNWNELLGQTSMAVINGAHHKFLRSSTAPAFSKAALTRYLPTVQHLTMSNLSLWADYGKNFRDPEPEIQLYTFQVAQQLLIGVDIDSKDLLWLADTFKAYCGAFTGALPFNVPWTAHGQGMRARAQLVKFYTGVIAKKRANPSAEAHDMLTDLMNARENGQALSDEELCDLCLVFLFAGHDTTKTSIQSMLYYLQKHPEIVKEMQDELSHIWDGKSAITMEMTEKTRKGKCGRFLDEMLRLTPPIPSLYRIATQDIHIQGFVIPKGWKLMSSPICQHANISSNQTDIDMSIDHSKLREDQYSPFGGGVRKCIGYSFAKLELDVWLMCILKHFNVKLDPTKSRMNQLPFIHWKVSMQIDRK